MPEPKFAVGEEVFSATYQLIGKVENVTPDTSPYTLSNFKYDVQENDGPRYSSFTEAQLEKW